MFEYNERLHLKFVFLAAKYKYMISTDTIVALATPSGAGAIAVIRLSGPEAVSIAAEVFQSVSGKDIRKQPTHTIHLGHIVDGAKVLDQVLLSLF